MSANPKPDEFGRYRVEQDTGTKFSIQRTPLDGEKVLKRARQRCCWRRAPAGVPGLQVSVESHHQRPVGRHPEGEGR